MKHYGFKFKRQNYEKDFAHTRCSSHKKCFALGKGLISWVPDTLRDKVSNHCPILIQPNS